MKRNLFGLLNPDLFALVTSTAVENEFIITKTLEEIGAERGLDLLPYLERHLAGDPGEISDQDRLSFLYQHATEWHGHYSVLTVLDDVRVAFASSKSRHVTFAALPEDAPTI